MTVLDPASRNYLYDKAKRYGFMSLFAEELQIALEMIKEAALLRKILWAVAQPRPGKPG